MDHLIFFLFATNILNIKQNAILIDNTMIQCFGNGNSTFSLLYCQNGFFFMKQTTTDIIKEQFTQEDIDLGLIYFKHDGSINPPLYCLKCVDDQGSSNTLVVNVVFHLLPKIIVNKFAVHQNSKIKITKFMIDWQNGINFNIKNATNCYFEFDYNPGIAIDNFTIDDLYNYKLFFVTTRKNESFI